MKILLCFLIAITFCGNGFAQNRESSDVEIISHRVLPGQTVRMISVKYMVTPADIYRLNKSALEGISQGMVLQIPLPVEKAANYKKEKQVAESQSAATPSQGKLHVVIGGETSSIIAERYKISITQLQGANPQLISRNPAVGENLVIPQN